MKCYRFDKLLLNVGWMSPAYVGVDGEGKITYIQESHPQEAVSVESIFGLAVPGFMNAHSHAFQYAMAGMAETHSAGNDDDFWSWRELMYRYALQIGPDEVEAIAAMLYAEMLRNGYTHVAEFHYLHHDRDGRPYSNYAEMGERLIAAASSAGINITLIPIFYQKGNFGKGPLPQQRRFISSNVDDYLQLLDDSASAVMRYRQASLGFGVHSLRAVDHHDILKTFAEGPKTLPFHLHAAEQLKEVEDCKAFLKARPIEWLLGNMPLDRRFNIVHCTHLTDAETEALALSQANAVLCPGTEGNLGDGVFRLTDYSNHGGRWSIGTDSHINLNPLEDLRWLDYAQRFTTHKRNTFDDGGRKLLSSAYHNGRLAMGIESSVDFFDVGLMFDAVIYNSKAPMFLQVRSLDPLPSILYTADSSVILGTMVRGKWAVKEGRHVNGPLISQRYQQALASLRR